MINTMQLLTEIREVIKEELGISEEVIKLTNQFYDEMVNTIKNCTEQEKNETCIKKTCSMKFMINDIKVTSSITYRNFLSKEYNKLYDMPYITNGASFFVTNNLYFCFINVFAISGTIVKEKAMETIQHEMEHIYQQIQMGKGFGGESLYVKIKTDMESSDEGRNKIGKLFYYTLKYEQEGFCNGLYGYLMDINQPYSDDLLMKTESWQNYTFLKQTFNELKDNDTLKSIFNEYFTNFGITIKDIEKEINNYLHRIGRVIIKVKKDKINQGWKD